MDIAREKPKVKSKKLWLIGAGSLVIIAAVFVSAFTETAETWVDREQVRLATVEKGAFEIVVRAPGSFVPKEVRWLAAEVGGRVERVEVLPGAKVVPGDVIAELSNPELLTQLEELQWDLEATEAQQRAELMNLESRVLDQQLAELNAKNSYESSQMTYLAQQKLRARNMGSISEIEYETIRMETSQKKQHWEIEKSRTENLQKNLVAQSDVRAALLSKLKKQIKRVAEQVEELKIRATLRGVVQEVAIEPGQKILPGSNLAKLVQEDDLIARIQVPEVQVHSVSIGQEVVVDTRMSKVLGYISRVSPSVVEGAVEVDAEFKLDLPEEARPDLTVDAEIKVASLENALFVNRPAFSQSHQTMKIFKLDESEEKARKVTVEFGRGSASLIEIKSGLAPGDKVIVSDQTGLEKYNVLALSK